jgi:hypothetical protein
MKRSLPNVVVGVLVLLAGSASAAEPKADVPLGSNPEAFLITDVTGPSAGELMCYRCAYGQKPVVAILTKSLDGDLARLVKQIDSQLDQHRDKQLSAFVVLLSDDPIEAASQLKQWAIDQQIKRIPLATFEGADGPEAYRISKDAQLAVLMWVDLRVKFNRAYSSAKLEQAELESVTAATGKILK